MVSPVLGSVAAREPAGRPLARTTINLVFQSHPFDQSVAESTAMDWTTTTNRSIDRHRQPPIYHLSTSSSTHPPTSQHTTTRLPSRIFPMPNPADPRPPPRALTVPVALVAIGPVLQFQHLGARREEVSEHACGCSSVLQQCSYSRSCCGGGVKMCRLDQPADATGAREA